jgi:Tol biopolymer transport system component
MLGSMKSNTGEKPLQSWKEIGAYLQRNEVTVRRWEKEEGLPVHRHSHNLRSSVYAYPSEIDTWKLTRRALPARDAGRSWWRPVAAGLTTLLCLVMAGNGLHPQAVLAQSLTTRQIPMDGIYGLEPWSFSADGRWFATVEWTGPTNDLVLREVATGQRKVLQSGQCYGTPCAEADLPLLSPDLRQVAYNWYDSALPESRDPTREAQLRVIANEPGATPRVVAEGSYFYASAWSPDDTSILTPVDVRKGEQRIEWVRVSDGAVRVIKTIEGHIDYRLSLSPDGKYIAYAASPLNNSSERQVFLLTSDGSNETALTKGAGINDSPTWTPDGKHVLYTSNQSGRFDLLAMEVREGKPFGVPSIIKRDIGQITALGATTSGSFLYSASHNDAFDTVAEISETNGALMLRTVDKFIGQPPTWSPDGKFIAFGRIRPGPGVYAPLSPGAAYDLVVRTVKTGEERVYSHDGVHLPGLSGWYKDQKSLMVPVGNSKGQVAFDRLDLATGQFKEIVPGDPFYGGFARLSPDDRTLLINANDGKGNVDHVVAYDLKTGRRKTVFTSDSSGITFFFSPDGRRVAFIAAGKDGTQRFGVSNADGTGYREIHSEPAKDASAIVCWASDSRAILFGRRESEKETQLMRVPIEGGASESTDLRVPATVQLMITSPDGSHMALFSREHASELWALDNVVAALK